MKDHIIIIGGGLAGSEAAWQAATRGSKVILYEMRPKEQTAAHKTDFLAEIVCSNSLGSNDALSAPGILKNEMRQLNSLIIRVADEVRVPAGSALAVDRDKFALGVTQALESHPQSSELSVKKSRTSRMTCSVLLPPAPSPLAVFLNPWVN